MGSTWFAGATLTLILFAASACLKPNAPPCDQWWREHWPIPSHTNLKFHNIKTWSAWRSPLQTSTCCVSSSRLYGLERWTMYVATWLRCLSHPPAIKSYRLEEDYQHQDRAFRLGLWSSGAHEANHSLKHQRTCVNIHLFRERDRTGNVLKIFACWCYSFDIYEALLGRSRQWSERGNWHPHEVYQALVPEFEWHIRFHNSIHSRSLATITPFQQSMNINPRHSLSSIMI